MMSNLAPFSIDENTFLQQNINLPPLPRTLLSVVQVIHSKTSGAAEATELISRDAAMVTHLLKVVNSAYYALPRRIGNLQHAVAYLGLAEVSRICLTLSVINSLKPEDKMELQYFWRHSYFTALIAKTLVKDFREIGDIGELYSAALLHDVGQLFYQRLYPEHFVQMRKYCREKGVFLVDAEQHYGFPSHLTFGALLCDHWGLPPTIRRACSFHELRDLKTIVHRSKAEAFDVIIVISNLIASLAAAKLNEQLKEEVIVEIRRVLEASKEQFLAFLGEVYELERKADGAISQMF
jgi:HD-like signal output (HDOD) protein